MEANIISIAAGKTQTYGKKDEQFNSAYKKDQFFNYCDVDDLGLIEDSQCDKRYHGGVDKALHIGSLKHFKNFEKKFGYEMDKLAMGCNIIIDNLDEDDVCVGDIYSIGDIKVEVCQPRQPCWKIGALFGKEVSRYIIKAYATGWYVRVLNDGIIESNDTMKLESRVSNTTVKQLSKYLHKVPEDKVLVDQVLSIESLADSYKRDLEEKSFS